MERLFITKRFGHADEACSICLEDMYRTMCIYLPCKHAIHYKCFTKLINIDEDASDLSDTYTRDTYTRDTYTCPLCRHNLNNSLIFLGIKVEKPIPDTIPDTIPIEFHLTIYTDEGDDDEEIIVLTFSSLNDVFNYLSRV
jgi:hypothetical protein